MEGLWDIRRAVMFDDLGRDTIPILFKPNKLCVQLDMDTVLL